MTILRNQSEAVEKLLQQECVGIFQGHSEWGPRALGNRSMLFDARNPNAKEIVNRIKKREWWRPFAGTILFEHAHEWFDLGTLEESPFMTFAVDAKQIALDFVPSIIHNGTCRIQTLKREQNPNFYNLISEFYERTGTPIILNTSLNLAKEPLVETIKDMQSMIRRSEFKYAYVPQSENI